MTKREYLQELKTHNGSWVLGSGEGEEPTVEEKSRELGCWGVQFSCV